MLLTLVYHHVHAPKQGLHIPVFARHLEQLVNQYPIVVPGDPIPLDKMHVCLTFDDAFFDFYFFVFPLLKKLNVKAILAVPTAFIEEDTTLSANERLNVEGYDGLHQGKSFSQNPFCTWRELKEMADSGHVILASHSDLHKDFALPETDIEEEIARSIMLIQHHTGITPQIFVYPFGHFNHAARKLAEKNFVYTMRVGHALNMSWRGLIYRVDAEKFWPVGKEFTQLVWIKWFYRMLFNRLRGR